LAATLAMFFVTTIVGAAGMASREYERRRKTARHLGRIRYKF
jgi:uncharacterized protein (DUF2384 family)